MANINLNDKLKNANEDLTLTMAGELKKEKSTNRRSALNFQKFYANGAFQN